MGKRISRLKNNSGAHDTVIHAQADVLAGCHGLARHAAFAEGDAGDERLAAGRGFECVRDGIGHFETGADTGNVPLHFLGPEKGISPISIIGLIPFFSLTILSAVPLMAHLPDGVNKIGFKVITKEGKTVTTTLDPTVVKELKQLSAKELDDVAKAAAKSDDLADGLKTIENAGKKGGASNVAKLGKALEQKAKDFVRLNLGETVIETQYKRGIDGLGFDFLSFTGKGSNAKLFINEVKDYTGKVPQSKFTTFGMGARGTPAFDDAIAAARAAIERAGLDRATKDALGSGKGVRNRLCIKL